MASSKNVYTQILEAIFTKHYRKGVTELVFERTEIVQTAQELGIRLPKNVGDLIYSFRYRVALPPTITSKAPEGYEWIIRPAGTGRYRLALVKEHHIAPTEDLVETKVLDATPGIISAYALTDEQALLAKLRYNRLIDLFTGLVCYSLQSHLRTSVPGMGQVETDEIYVGIDKRGVQYVLPVQAKGGRDRLGIVQIEQDFAVCAAKFPGLICRLIAAQFAADNSIVLFELEQKKDGVGRSAEKRYRLVRPEELSTKELESYRQRQF